MRARTIFIGFTDRVLKLFLTMARKWIIDNSPLFVCVLLIFACVPTALATPPSTPIQLELALSHPPQFAEWVTVNVTVKSSVDVPNTYVELILPEGTATQTKSWIVNLTQNVPLSLTSDVSIEKTGNLTVAARALRRVDSDTVWGDMKAIPFYIGPPSLPSLAGLDMAWNANIVPVGRNTAPGNANLMSMEPTLFPYNRVLGELSSPASSGEPSTVPRLASVPSSVSLPTAPGTVTLTGKWRYDDRSNTQRDIDEQLIEIRKGDGSPLSPRIFCYSEVDGTFSCSFTHPGTTMRVWVRSWTNFSIPGTTNRLGVFSGPEVPGGCGSDGIDCSYPVQTAEISCTDGTTCNVGTWVVETSGAGEPWLGAHQMTQDLIRSWKKLWFDNRHPAGTSAGPARINYPVPSGHGTHAHVGSGEFDGWISVEPPNQQSADIVTHEYGHVVMSNLWSSYSPVWPTFDCPSSHFIQTVSGAGCALSEGFADFWAWYSNELYDGDNSSANDGPIFNWPGGASTNLESRDTGTYQTGDQVEGNIAAALGDIFDFANDGPSQGPADHLSDGIQHIWHTIFSQSENNFSQWWSAYWSTFSHDPCPALDILNFNSIQYSMGQCNNATGTPFLSFPLPNRTPDNAIINSIFDHYMITPYATGGVQTTAYTGETGRGDKPGCSQDPSFSRPAFTKYDPITDTCHGGSFRINDHYSGGIYLYYDNHPGYDYKTTDQAVDGQIAVFAAASGTVQTTGVGCSVTLSDYRAVMIFHDSPNNEYATCYLHLSSITAGIMDGVHVTKGTRIGTSGDTGAKGSPHLHFEVRKNINGTYVAVDPYGWQGQGIDPYNTLNPSYPMGVNIPLWETTSQTLFLSLIPNPSTGTASLNTNLTATVSGTAVGTINYTFWWDCRDAGGTSVSEVTVNCGDPNNPVIGAKFDGVTDNPKTLSHTYSAAPGVYTPKVIAERGSAPPATSSANISVTPATPSLVSPANGTVLPVATTSITLQWTSESGATSYEVQVATGGCGGTVFGGGTSFGPTSLAISNLSNGQTYFWRVRSFGLGGSSPYSNCFTFSISNPNVSDTTGPSLLITSHSNNQTVITSPIAVSGTASDSGKGNNGISSVTVNGLAANNGTASGSGTANWSRSVTLSPGANTITVVAKDNSSNQNATTVQISVNYQPAPSVSINDVSVTEGNSGTKNANFTVTLSAVSGQTVTVNYSTANHTATSGSDYVAKSAILTFNPGETTKTIPVVVNGDTVFEPNETFFVNLTSATNATIADGQGIGTIINDDSCIFLDKPPVDFDGDCKTDIGIYRNGAWFILRSSDGGVTNFGWGGASWEPVVADYDGDGKADIAVYNANGLWSIMRSSDGGNTLIGWSGAAGDIPVPADYDGDGKADLAVYNKATAGWSIIRSSDGGLTYKAWGGPAWEPVAADYDGDGKTDIAVYNANGLWSIIRSSDGGHILIGWSGAVGDIPVPADYDGDGKADLAVYNTVTAGWSIIRSSDGGLTYKAWGGPAWEPVAADYDGDGKADIAVYNPNLGLWSIVRSSDGGNTLVGWGGGAQDIPLN